MVSTNCLPETIKLALTLPRRYGAEPFQELGSQHNSIRHVDTERQHLSQAECLVAAAGQLLHITERNHAVLTTQAPPSLEKPVNIAIDDCALQKEQEHTSHDIKIRGAAQHGTQCDERWYTDQPHQQAMLAGAHKGRIKIDANKHGEENRKNEVGIAIGGVRHPQQRLMGGHRDNMYRRDANCHHWQKQECNQISHRC